MNKLPPKVNISGIAYDIIEVEGLCNDDGKLNGRISYSTTEISIEKKQSYQSKIITLWHEIIHALLSHADVEHDEKIAVVLGTGIVGVIQDNRGKLC